MSHAKDERSGGDNNVSKAAQVGSIHMDPSMKKCAAQMEAVLKCSREQGDWRHCQQVLADLKSCQNSSSSPSSSSSVATNK
jgi:hypothetical protein